MTADRPSEGTVSDERSFLGLRPRSVARDAAFVVTWVVVVSVGWSTPDWPVWLYYVAVFAGIVAYTVATAWLSGSVRRR